MVSFNKDAFAKTMSVAMYDLYKAEQRGSSKKILAAKMKRVEKAVKNYVNILIGNNVSAFTGGKSKV